jgi:hypothetical protein
LRFLYTIATLPYKVRRRVRNRAFSLPPRPSFDKFYLIFVEILDVDEELGHLKLSIKNIEYKKKVVVRRKRIRETSLGFKTLEYKLPIWIEESLKKIKNK